MESDARALETSCASKEEFGSYDVFISHRGPDTKTGFVGFLYDALKRASLHPFLDCESIGKGQDCWSCIDHAIQTTPLALVVFSGKFAQSQWCLKELHAMLESPSVQVLPIFYDVQPWEVRFPEKGQLAVGFAKLSERHDAAVVEEWRSDLRRASELNGWEHKVGGKRLEKDLVIEVVKEVFELVNNPLPLDVGDYVVGVKPVVEKLIQVSDEKKVLVLGLWGMGGIGKSTLARELYNRLERRFDAGCFVGDVAERVNQDGVTSVQSHILKALCENESIPSILEKSRGKALLERRLSRRSVLVVLDDVRDDDEMYYLMSRKMLEDGGMCIVTSRDRRVFEKSTSFSVDDEVHTHEVQVLREEDSRIVFACHALGGHGKVKPRFDGFVGGIIRACGGIPLVLKVVGSLLRFEEDERIWEEVLRKLRCGSIMDARKVFECLRMSYDALEEEHQKMFLDIACALLGQPMRMAECVWRSQGWSPALGVRSLVEKALIRMDEGGYFGMHDHLRDMGRAIARQTSAIVGICERFCMPSLLAMLKNDEPTQGFVRPFIWDDFNASDLGLIVKVKEWVGLLPTSFDLENVRWLDCFYSSVPFPKTLPTRELVVFSWRDDDLQSLPTSFEMLKKLEFLELYKCGKLKVLPSAIGGLESLKYFSLVQSIIQSVPESFGLLSNLERLCLMDCGELHKLPNSIRGLQNLKYLGFKE